MGGRQKERKQDSERQIKSQESGYSLPLSNSINLRDAAADTVGSPGLKRRVLECFVVAAAT